MLVSCLFCSENKYKKAISKDIKKKIFIGYIVFYSRIVEPCMDMDDHLQHGNG